MKIDFESEIVDRGSTNLGVNKAGFTLHSAIYASRPDVKCIVHIHTAAGAAVRDRLRISLPSTSVNLSHHMLCGVVRPVAGFDHEMWPVAHLT